MHGGVHGTDGLFGPLGRAGGAILIASANGHRLARLSAPKRRAVGKGIAWLGSQYSLVLSIRRWNPASLRRASARPTKEETVGLQFLSLRHRPFAHPFSATLIRRKSGVFGTSVEQPRRRAPVDPDEMFEWPSTEADAGSGNLSTQDWVEEGVLKFVGYKAGNDAGGAVVPRTTSSMFSALGRL